MRGFSLRMRAGAILGGGILILTAAASRADVVYVVRFQTGIVYSSPLVCYHVGWRDHLLFRNNTEQDLTVRMLSVSNGYELTSPQPLVVPSRRIKSVFVAQR